MHSEITKELMTKADYYIFNDRVHFKVEDVKKLLPDHKINTNMIVEKAIEGQLVPLINDDGIEEMTEFDKKIRQSLNFNPKK